VIRNGALCHDLRMQPNAPDHRLDRYAPVIVLVHIDLRLCRTDDSHDELQRRDRARQQLHAVEKINGKSSDYQLVVLFLCNHNAGRSPMAMGLFNHLAGGGAAVWSGGSEPRGKINPAAVAVMAERGIDISGEYHKPWTGEIIAAADVIVSMGCGDRVPALPGCRYEDWDLDDPSGKDVAEVRLIRDQIERRARELLDDLRIPYRS